MKKCGNCGINFTPKYPVQVYCTKKCYCQKRYERKKNNEKAPLEGVCQKCGNAYTKKNAIQKYCYDPCGKKATYFEQWVQKDDKKNDKKKPPGYSSACF